MSRIIQLHLQLVEPLRDRVGHRQDEIGDLGVHAGRERFGDLGLIERVKITKPIAVEAQRIACQPP